MPEQPKPERTEEISRKDIAQSLGSKDPTWFRQTEDRGVGSAAFRRNQGDAASNTISVSGRRQLPGMSRESTPEPEKSPIPAMTRGISTSPSQDVSSLAASRLGDRYSSTSSFSTIGETKSPLPLSTSQRLMPSRGDTFDDAPRQNAETVFMQPPQSRGSSDRPSSPTKGLGGFVQSAMMKRSDSVNKRWSAQAAPGLKRGDSVAGSRGTLGNFSAVPLTRGGSPPRDTNSNLGPPSSPSNHSRPGSSHSTSTVVQKPAPEHQPTPYSRVDGFQPLRLDFETSTSADEPSKATDESKRSDAISGSRDAKEELPISPTKTMDPKRWSPTKASWLESALSKPESPKVMSPKVDQPTWKTDLQRSKQTKADSDGSKNTASTFEVASQSGLLRSPPLGGHSRPLSVGGLPEGFSSGMVKKAAGPPSKPSPVQENVPARSPDRHEASPDESFSSGVPSKPTPEVASAKMEPEPNTNTNTNTPEIAMSNAPDSLAASLSKREASALKPKPQTPPKTDFRANLKPRRQDSQDSSSTEPEFKNVFGKLRRAETKNYVAPDELKKNILTGKAALSQTGGPQKTMRTDEFKESLLSQKEAMKVGGGSIHKKSEAGKDSKTASEKPPAPIPEALARRKTLSRVTGASPVPVKHETSIQPLVRPKPSNTREDMPSKSDQPAIKTQPDVQSTDGSLEHLKPSTEAMQRTPVKSPDQPQFKSVASAAPPTVAANDAKGSGKLAGRLNPSLANILMRGPTSGPSSRNHSTEDLSTAVESSFRPVSRDMQDSGDSQLTHMTKGRAKGPKRRLPKSDNDNKSTSPQLSKTSDPNTTMQAAVSKVDDRTFTKAPEQVSRAFIKPSSPPPQIATKALSARPLATLVNQNGKVKPLVSRPLPKAEPKPVESVKSETVEKPKPVVAVKSPELRKVSSPKPSNSASTPALFTPIADSTEVGSTSSLAKRSLPSSEGKINSEEAPKASPLANGAKASWIRSDTSSTSASQRSQMSKADTEEPARLNGLGLRLNATESARVSGPHSEPTPPKDKAFTARASAETSFGATPGPAAATNDAPTVTNASMHAEVIRDFFDEQPKASDKADIDTHAVISAGDSTVEKTKTLRMQIWEVNGDGKRQDMPPQQEHILFEECMYLCVHSFENSKGSKATEAYLWCGDGVGEAAIEDAQLFCRKVARENSAKLEVFKQGKETASFIQGIGGILITRRAKSSALYMLCGRRHLAHVCFDEVDLDAKCLCSGFPYLISAKFGKLYLWKGKGSGADELGCARLIGMDLGLTGEIEEVSEAEEPSSFWEAFSGSVSSTPKSSAHWSQKGNHDQYACRLFRVEIEPPKAPASFWSRRGSSPAKTTKTAHVQEITPFEQRDLDPSHIYVLDAYLEAYV